jgi:hypothetical protein
VYQVWLQGIFICIDSKKFDFFRLKSFVTAKVWLSAPSV